MATHNQHPGFMTDFKYEKRGDKYYCIETWECPMTAEQLEDFRTSFNNEKAAALSYDANVTITNADAELAKINAVKPE